MTRIFPPATKAETLGEDRRGHGKRPRGCIPQSIARPPWPIPDILLQETDERGHRLGWPAEHFQTHVIAKPAPSIAPDFMHRLIA